MPVPGLVHHNPVDPGLDCGLAAKTANRAEDAKEDLLGQVERLIAVAEEVQRQLHDHPLMLGNELGERDLIPSRAALDECRLSPSALRPAAHPSLRHGDHGTQYRPRTSPIVPRAQRLLP